jgi:hypothetical protein
VSSGKSTGPKGIRALVGHLEEGDYILVSELREFLTDQLQLLDDEVREAMESVLGEA